MFSINMQQFRDKWIWVSDNVKQGETILACNGKFTTDSPDQYTEWLNTFNIFYTYTGKIYHVE